MSSMYLYCARQSSEEFSALETTRIAMSFSCASVRSAACASVGSAACASVGSAAACPESTVGVPEAGPSPVNVSSAGTPPARRTARAGIVHRADFRGTNGPVGPEAPSE
jgi:hypothetical protein